MECVVKMNIYCYVITLTAIFQFAGKKKQHKTYIYSLLLFVFVFQQFWQPGLQPSTSQDVKPFAQPVYPGSGKTATAVSAIESNLQTQHSWEGRSIATQKFRLVEFSAYLDLNADDAVSDVS